MEGKIALEEHFAIPETINPAHDARYASWFPAWPDIKRRLLDLEQLRLPEMDKGLSSRFHCVCGMPGNHRGVRQDGQRVRIGGFDPQRQRCPASSRSYS